MTSLAMPKPDKTTLAKRGEIAAQLRKIVPGEGVVEPPTACASSRATR
jgi:glycolate oxidase